MKFPTKEELENEQRILRLKYPKHKTYYIKIIKKFEDDKTHFRVTWRTEYREGLGRDVVVSQDYMTNLDDWINKMRIYRIKQPEWEVERDEF